MFASTCCPDCLDAISRCVPSNRSPSNPTSVPAGAGKYAGSKSVLGMRVLAALASAQLVGARAMLHLCITRYAMVAALAPPLAEELARVRERRRIRSAGLAAGGGLVGAASLLLAPQHPEAVAAAAAAAAAVGRDSIAWALAAPPETPPLGEEALAVRAAGAKGDGLFAAAAIEKDAYLMDYVGEVIDQTELDKRLEHHNKHHPGNHNMYIMELDHGTYIDARRSGSVSRYINHSCDPNCAVSFDGTSLQLHSAREIAAGVRCMLACICDSRGRHACVLAAFRA